MNIIFLFVFFVGGGWLIGKIVGNLLFPKNEKSHYFEHEKKGRTVINNYTTEQHLHISKEDLKELL